MSDETAAPGGANEPVTIPFTPPAPADDTATSLSEAARQLSAYRWKRDNPEAAKAEAPAPVEAAAEATPDSAQADDAPATDHVETAPAPEPAEELPTIEPPRSWTQADKEEFQSYPREAQEKIARREQEREQALRRGQNEVAEQRKAIEAERQKAEQVRQQYETALPALLQTMQEQQQGEFADIKTMADVQKLAREDWPRYALWDAQQKQIAAVASEVKATQDRAHTDFRKSWSEYATKQDELLKEREPDLADKSKSSKIADGAVTVLKDKGFTEQELAQLWNGEASISLRDHRVQSLILDGVRYREAKANVAKPAKPVPPVAQRPGVSKAPVNANDAEIQALEKRFERDPSIQNATALRAAKVRAA